MSKEKGFCEVCGTEIEIKMCCSGHMCGCYGLPVDPPVCSGECYDTFMSKEYQDKKQKERETAYKKLNNHE
jgi:hypothetical protein